jgi:hypothetical protein
VRAFFVEKYEQIFAVLLARFGDLESSQKKGSFNLLPPTSSSLLRTHVLEAFNRRSLCDADARV